MDAISPLGYDQVRDMICDGDVVFVSKQHGFVSALIRFFTRSKFSHCTIAFWVDVCDEKRLMCIEAQGGTRRRILNLSFYQQKGMTLYVVTPPKDWCSVAHTALEKLGEVKYGYFEAFYVGIREWMLKNFRIKFKEIQFDGEICSEFIARTYGLKEVAVSPELLFEQLMETQQLRFIVQG